MEQECDCKCNNCGAKHECPKHCDQCMKEKDGMLHCQVCGATAEKPMCDNCGGEMNCHREEGSPSVSEYDKDDDLDEVPDVMDDDEEM